MEVSIGHAFTDRRAPLWDPGNGASVPRCAGLRITPIALTSSPLSQLVDDEPPYLVPHSQEPIRLLYRDPHLLIVDKPTLLLSVPGRHPKNRDCLLDRLSVRYPGVSAVHRLDLDTSGVMVVPARS